MNAIEIVKDRDSREADTELTDRITAIALKKGLILITAGPARNVIRLLVPLSASDEVVEEGLDILESALEEALT